VTVYAKAILAAIAAGLAFAAPVAGDGLSLPEILGALAAALTAGGVVWRVPNAEPS